MNPLKSLISKNGKTFVELKSKTKVIISEYIEKPQQMSARASDNKLNLHYLVVGNAQPNFGEFKISQIFGGISRSLRTVTPIETETTLPNSD